MFKSVARDRRNRDHCIVGHRRQRPEEDGSIAIQSRRGRGLTEAAVLGAMSAFWFVYDRDQSSSTPGLFRLPNWWIIILGFGCAIMAGWRVVSTMIAPSIVISDAGVSVGRSTIAWSDITDVAIRRGARFLSFGRFTKLDLRSSATSFEIEVSNLSCSESEFAAAFDTFAERHGVTPSVLDPSTSGGIP